MILRHIEATCGVSGPACQQNHFCNKFADRKRSCVTLRELAFCMPPAVHPWLMISPSPNSLTSTRNLLMKILPKTPGLPTTRARRSEEPLTEIARIESPRRHTTRLFCAGFLAAVVLVASSAQGRENGQWIETWSASPQPVWTPDFFAPINFPRNLWNQTIRQTARVSVGGDKLRVVLSNEYGSQPLVIGAAHVALSDQGSAIKAGSDRVLTFSHKESFTIPPGALAISDPVDLTVPPLGSVSVSFFLPKVTPTATMHWDGRQTAYIVAGNKVADLEITPDSKTESRLFLSGI